MILHDIAPKMKAKFFFVEDAGHAIVGFRLRLHRRDNEEDKKIMGSDRLPRRSETVGFVAPLL